MVNNLYLILKKYFYMIENIKYISESMGFGTLEYDLKSSHDSKETKKKFNKKWNKNQPNQSAKTSSNKKTEAVFKKEEAGAIYPKLPDNWVKKTVTGDVSYDQTVTEIEKKLKRTQVKDNSNFNH